SVDWSLWFGVLGAPVAWSLHLLVSYTLVSPVCFDGGIIALHLISLALAAVALAAGLVTLREWRRTRGRGQVDIHGTGSRRGFMALFGVLASVVFFVGLLMAWVPIFVVDPCEGVSWPR
ncbi:MAG: hypothetical protein M3Q03_16045, partial [Chloroflexota bacterium]|nr:hypothetical protein [Chloroflexota bacterium]